MHSMNISIASSLLLMDGRIREQGNILIVIDLNRQKFIVPLKAIFDYSISTLSAYDTVIKITTYNDVELTWNFL